MYQALPPLFLHGFKGHTLRCARRREPGNEACECWHWMIDGVGTTFATGGLTNPELGVYTTLASLYAEWKVRTPEQELSANVDPV